MRARRGIGLVAMSTVVAACAPNGPAAPPPVPVSTFARPAADQTAVGPPSTAPTTTPRAPDADDPTTPTPPITTTITSTTHAAATTTTAPTTVATTTTLPPDPPPPNSSFDRLELALELVADVYKPTGIAWRDGDSAMYVSTQPGPVLRVDGGTITTVIDFTGQTFEDTPGSERGVLGIAFDPRDGRMFLNYTDLADDTQVVSYELVDGVADPATRRTVLTIDQPGLGHNGGRLAFDAGGNLYIASGDGGASNGWDAQDTTKLLGALLRVRPTIDGDGYEIPADNPFADGVGDRPEVIARGFRNPWTFSIDDDTGDIWIGDVGNNTMEEVSLLPRSRWGANFGWPYLEGTDIRRGDRPDDLVPPVYAYGHDVGTAVMGGHVYRGSAIPELRGAYLFGDLTGPVWAIGADGVTRLGIGRVSTFVGWAEDPDGELYLLGFDGVHLMVKVPPPL